MKLLLIRHCESEADLMDAHEGRADFPLTERGHLQARAMAERISRQFSLSKIYCSTLQRAMQTAGHLENATGAALTADERLMEFQNGLIAGMNRAEAKLLYPQVENLPVHESVYCQESVLDFRFRADYMLSKMLSENGPEDTVAVVTHGGMLVQLYRSFLRLPVDSDVFFLTGDTGIHCWAVDERGRRVIFANDTSHLQGI